VSRYFFSIRWPDRVDSDLLGTLLTDDAAALAHAVRIIRELSDPRNNDGREKRKAQNGAVAAIPCGLRLMPIRCG
jgi:Domain of unknown function (DUF6894)